ncbi:tetratricopeptide repeat protein [Actinosynnema sp. NPDC049800]
MLVEIRLLGHVGIGNGDGTFASPARTAVLCLLAVFATEVGKPVGETALMDWVWRDDGLDEPARGTLRRNVEWVRDAIEEAGGNREWLVYDHRSRCWTLQISRSVVDYYRFADEVDGAHQHPDPDRLQRALGMWRGPALSNVNRRWADTVRNRYDIHRRAAQKALFIQLLNARRHDDVISLLGPFEDDIVHDEQLLLLGARALALTGRHAQIGRWAARIAARARDELGAGRSTSAHAFLQQLIANPPGHSLPAARSGGSPAQSGATPAPNNLPRDIPDFTGRERELNELITAVERVARDGVTAITIHAINGMPGVGKTALGTHVAHALAPRFPDGQLFLDLYGHTPGQKPRTPSDALHSLLLDLGVSPHVLGNHKTVDDRARLWRTLVANRKLLLVFDDAATHDQVTPLLPGAPESLVLITSRNQLPELDGVHHLTLAVLPLDEASQMLLRLAHRAPDPNEADEVTRVVELCGRLPLAIAITASQLRAHPTWSVRHIADLLAAQLAHADDKLDELDFGGRSVKASFDMSFRDLPSEQREMFTLLGLHYGPEIDAHAAAAMSDTTPARARRTLDALHSRHLVQETSAGRYRLHDLLRAYAQTHAVHLDPDHRRRVTTRLLDYYLHTAHTAIGHLPSRKAPSTHISLTVPAYPSSITDADHAMDWLGTELPTLVTTIENAHSTHPVHVIHLSATLHPYFRTAGHWHHAHTIHHAARIAAIQTKDSHAQATALNDLGYVYWRRGDLDAAVDAHTEALELFVRGDNFAGQATAFNNLGRVHLLRGDLDAAVEAQTQARDLFSRSDDLEGQATVLNNLGWVHLRRGDLDSAVDAQTHALELFVLSDNLAGQGNALNSLGRVYLLRGDVDAAVDAQMRALELSTRSGDLLGQGAALNNLGRAYLRRGDVDAAVDAQMRALELSTRSGDLLGQGAALNDLGRAYLRRGDVDAAVDVHMRALELSTRSEYLLGQANAHLGMGVAHRRQHDPVTAVTHLVQALHLFDRAEDSDGQAETHNALGSLALDHPEAGDAHYHYTTALALARSCGSRLHQANALVGQAEYLHRSGNTREAVFLVHQALTIHRSIKAPEVAHTVQLLNNLDSEQSGNPDDIV